MASKSADAFRTISEVAEWLDTPTHVLRFWESKFSQIKPVKRAGGRRYYRPDDMLLLGGIKKLLHDDGHTINGVQKLLRKNGVKHVAAYSRALGGQDENPYAALLTSSGDEAEATPEPDKGQAIATTAEVSTPPPPHPKSESPIEGQPVPDSSAITSTQQSGDDQPDTTEPQTATSSEPDLFSALPEDDQTSGIDTSELGKEDTTRPAPAPEIVIPLPAAPGLLSKLNALTMPLSTKDLAVLHAAQPRLAALHAQMSSPGSD